MTICRLFVQLAVCWLCRCVISFKAYIISPPQNAVILAGEEVTLTCATNGSANDVQWSFSNKLAIRDKSSTPCVTYISYFEGISPGNGSGICNIRVLPDGLGVSGLYGCSEPPGTTYYATLVVMVSRPTCVPDVDPVVRGSTFNLICSANFTLGSEFLRNDHVTAWISCDGLGSSNRVDYKPTLLTDPTIFQLPSIQFPMNASGSSLGNYTCTAHFDFADTRGADPVAKNSVNFTSTSNESVTFHYCPGDVIIAPLGGPYFGGGELSCSANSYPPPSYQWIGLAPSPINGSTVKLPTNGGSFDITCSATGDLLDRNCTAYSHTITLFAIVCPYNVTINPTNPVVTVNTTLTCAANSTSQSPATYLWTNLLDNGTVSGPRITIDKPGSYSWECSVSVPEGGSNCNSSQTVSGTAVECPSESNTVITSSGGSGSVLVGDVFNCSLHTDQPASYQWYDGSGHLLSSSSSVVVNVSGVFSWTCVVTVTVGSLSCNGSTSINGTAYECPSNITIDPSSKTAVKLFDNLTCSASGSSPSHYSWRNETAYELSTTTVLSVNTTGQHSYTCTVTLTAGNRNCADNKTISVTVVDCPHDVTIQSSADCPHDVTIQSSAGSEPLLVGDVLKCSATSYPAANYSWHDDSGQLVSSVSTVNVTRAAAFRWTCNASVSVDGLICSAFNSTNATPLECPSNVTIEPWSRRVAKLHDSFQCFSSGNVTNFTWLNDAGAVESTTHTLTVTKLGGNLTYTCQSTLQAGNRQCNASQQITIDVIDCPSNVTIQTPSSSSAIYVGDTFNCTAVSSAHVSYSWYDQYNNLLSNDPSVTIRATGDFVLNCTATVELNGITCVNSTIFNGTATVTTTITTASSTPTTSVASTSTDSTTSSTTSSAPTTVAATSSTSSVPTTSPTSSVPTTSSTAVSTATTSSSSLSSTAAATATSTITKEASSTYTASSTEGNDRTTADNTNSPSAATTQNPAVTIIEIAVPVTVGLVAMATAGVWCSYYALNMAKRGIKLRNLPPPGLAKPAVAEPSVYSPGYAFRPYYGNGNGRF